LELSEFGQKVPAKPEDWQKRIGIDLVSVSPCLAWRRRRKCRSKGTSPADAAVTPSKDRRISDREAVRIVEETDASPQQAKELVKKHGREKGKEQARKLKNES
jgi:hypothetical protein